jgi:hypothetical protein
MAGMGSTMKLIGAGSAASRDSVVVSTTCREMTAIAVGLGSRYWMVSMARRMRFRAALGGLRVCCAMAPSIWNRQSSENGEGGCL